MKFIDAITTGVIHLWQHKLRSGLSILGIFIGISSVLCMLTIGDGAKLIITEDIEKIGGANQIEFGVYASTFRGGRLMPTTERLTFTDVLAIEAECPSIRFALPKNERHRMLVTSKDGAQALPTLEGVTADYALGMHWNVQEGKFLSENDINNATQVCVLGANTATDLFGDTSPLGQEVKIRYRWRQIPVRLRIVGVMAPKGRSFSFIGWNLDDSLSVPLTTYQQRLSGNDYVDRIVVFTEKGVDMETIISTTRIILRRNHRNRDDFVWHWIPKKANERLNQIAKVIKIALGSIAGFSLFVGSVSIMNLCLVSVGEKTREIGLRKSVGAKRIDIFWQFLTESICLCFCGGVLGIPGCWLAAHGMARLAVRIVPIVPEWPVVFSFPWILISTIFSIFIGMSFGVYPAMRAARMSPIDALRTEN